MRALTIGGLLLALGAAGACRRAAEAPPLAADAAARRTTKTATPNPSVDLAYVCPMDREIRSSGPGSVRGAAWNWLPASPIRPSIT